METLRYTIVLAPLAAIYVLRTGLLHTPTAVDLEEALEETRARMDAGHLLETAPSPTDDDLVTIRAED